MKYFCGSLFYFGHIITPSPPTKPNINVKINIKYGNAPTMPQGQNETTQKTFVSICV